MKGWRRWPRPAQARVAAIPEPCARRACAAPSRAAGPGAWRTASRACPGQPCSGGPERQRPTRKSARGLDGPGHRCGPARADPWSWRGRRATLGMSPASTRTSTLVRSSLQGGAVQQSRCDRLDGSQQQHTRRTRSARCVFGNNRIRMSEQPLGPRPRRLSRRLRRAYPMARVATPPHRGGVQRPAPMQCMCAEIGAGLRPRPQPRPPGSGDGGGGQGQAPALPLAPWGEAAPRGLRPLGGPVRAVPERWLGKSLLP